MKKITPKDLAQINKESLGSLTKEEVINFTLRLKDQCIELYERLNKNSRNSSKPPSSDNPFQKGNEDLTDSDLENEEIAPEEEIPGPGNDANEDNKNGKTEKRRPGKQPGAQGFWRSETPEPNDTQNHCSEKCAICEQPLDQDIIPYCHTGHYTYELEKDKHGIRIVCILHLYYTTTCTSCGHENAAMPGQGYVSVIEGRKRDLVLSEHTIVGPMLAIYIATLNRDFKMSRCKIRQYLIDWYNFELSVGTIDKCIREAGVACYPVVDQLIEELQEQEQVHMDETPWFEKGKFLWIWVAVNSQIAVYHIGSRTKEELLKLITVVFCGWLITDGYMGYRFYGLRQRCLAHLIRKAVALAGGVDQKAAKMGNWFLKEMRGLIKAMAQGEDGKKECRPILARLKRACNLGSKTDHAKLKALANEILNDWDAVVAFVKNTELPATNNEAERALRQAVISRRILFGTRTNEGSQSYAAFISVMETCKRRGINYAEYIASVLANGRKGIAPPPLPKV